MAKSKSNTATTTTREDNLVVRYFKETRAELRKVAWPTRDETVNLTTIIVTVTVAVAIFLGLLDFIFQEVMSGVLRIDFIWLGLALVLLVGGAAAFYFNNLEQ